MLEMDKSSRRRLLFMGISISFTSIFQMGYANAYPNTAVDSFRRYLNVSFASQGYDMNNSRFEWIWSAILNIYFLGFALGSFAAAPISDKVGRKWCLVLGNTFNFFSAILATSAILFLNPFLFFISRVIFSLSAAISMNSLILLLQESCPSDMRGIMSFNAEMAFVVMNMVGALVGMKAVLGDKLEWITGLSCIPSLISILVALSFHESPKYLITKNKEEAVKSVCFYFNTDKQKAEEYVRVLENENGQQSTGVSMVPTTYFGLFLGILTLQITASIWPILFFSTEFLIRAGIDPELAEAVSTFMLFISTLSTVMGMFLVENCLRKNLLLITSIVNLSALVLFFLSDQFHHVPYMKYGCVLAVVMHGASYSCGLGPIAWFITAELVPTRNRAFCQSIALSINQIIALALSVVTLPLYTTIGSWILVLLFVVPGAICVTILYFYLPETRERDIEEVTKNMMSQAKFLKRQGGEQDIPMNSIAEGSEFPST
ncbi:unnamed protein product [Auanema sp. JU1783]|nr:unnamed protein product [Auanema sp. JU1783]